MYLDANAYVDPTAYGHAVVHIATGIVGSAYAFGAFDSFSARVYPQIDRIPA